MLSEEITREISLANRAIEALECITSVVAPESSLSDIISFENVTEEETNQRELKRVYMRKRKLLYFEDCLSRGVTLQCSRCAQEIELEKLLVMPKSRLCRSCSKSN